MRCSWPGGINLGNFSARVYDAWEVDLIREVDDIVVKDDYERYLLDRGKLLSIGTSTALE